VNTHRRCHCVTCCHSNGYGLSSIRGQDVIAGSWSRRQRLCAFFTCKQWFTLVTRNLAYYSIWICWPLKDERMSWPSWLNYSGRLTHIKWSPVSCRSNVGQERSTVKDQRFNHCATQLTGKGVGIFWRGHYIAVTIRWRCHCVACCQGNGYGLSSVRGQDVIAGSWSRRQRLCGLFTYKRWFT